MISLGPNFDLDDWRNKLDRTNAAIENATVAMTARSKTVIKGMEPQIITHPHAFFPCLLCREFTK
jgi:hypothetical protein